MAGRAKPRVAIIAFTSQPELGSEYEVGWQWALLGARISRAWVLTRRACWDAIPGRARLIDGWRIKRAGGAIWVAIDVPGAPRLFAGRRLMRTHYLIWQLLVWRQLRRHRRRFAFVHHLTFVAAWFPPFAAFCGLPLLWGPIGTNPPVPPFYRDRLGMGARLKAAVRALVTQSMVRRNPLLPLVATRTFKAFAISEHVRGLLPPALRQRTEIHPAIALDPAWLTATRSINDRSPTLLFVGRGMDIKLPRLALDVARQVIALRPDARAILIGEGLPDLLGNGAASDRLEVRAAIPQAQLRALYEQSAVFLFPSFEASGFVTLEAMAAGLPVACLAGTGAAFFSGPGNPLTIAPDSDWGTVRERMASSIIALLEDPLALERASMAARDRAADYAWDRYEPFLARLYAAAKP